MTRQCVLAILLLIILFFVTTAQLMDYNQGDSSEDIPERYAFMEEIKSKCRKRTGSNEIFKKIINISTVDDCLASKLDVFNFLNDLNHLVESTRAEFFQKYCPYLNDSISCYEVVASKLRQCLNLEERAVVDNIFSLLPEGLKLACKDNGQIFFNEETGLECTSYFLQISKMCSDKISNLTEAMNPTNYGPKHCDELVQFRKCFERKLIECKAPSVMEIFDLFYRPVLKAGACKYHIKQDDLPQLESNTS